MSVSLTIVAYHYVRDLAHSPFPRIKALATSDFRGQLDFISRNYNIVDSATLIEAVTARDPAILPPRPAYLTFDDGLIDHFRTVFPLLAERGLHGAFFVPAQPLRERIVVDVHKIHFILAACKHAEILVGRILASVGAARAEFNLEADAVYLSRYRKPGRFDDPASAFVKRMLQTALPERLSRRIIDSLFREFVTSDERGFAETLYCRIAQLREMAATGMYIGGHGDTHRRLDRLDMSAQDAEIDATLRLLHAAGTPTDRWIMCYPHGGYDRWLIDKLRARGCAVGLAVETGVAQIGRDDPLALPRLDTNHLPRSADAKPGEWKQDATLSS